MAGYDPFGALDNGLVQHQQQMDVLMQQAAQGLQAQQGQQQQVQPPMQAPVQQQPPMQAPAPLEQAPAPSPMDGLAGMEQAPADPYVPLEFQYMTENPAGSSEVEFDPNNLTAMDYLSGRDARARPRNFARDYFLGAENADSVSQFLNEDLPYMMIGGPAARAVGGAFSKGAAGSASKEVAKNVGTGLAVKGTDVAVRGGTELAVKGKELVKYQAPIKKAFGETASKFGGFGTKLGLSLMAIGGVGEYLTGESDIAEASPEQQEEVVHQLNINWPRVMDESDKKSFGEQARKIIENPVALNKLMKPDYSQYERFDSKPGLELIEQYGTSTKPIDPGFWEKAMTAMPYIIGGMLAMGPAGAILGAIGGYEIAGREGKQAEIDRQTRGQAYAQNHHNMKLQGHNQSNLDWLTSTQAQQQDEVRNAEYDRWQNKNRMEDHAFVMDDTTKQLDHLKSKYDMTMGDRRLAAADQLLARGAGGANGVGNKTPATDPKMTQFVVSHVINEQPDVADQISKEVMEKYGYSLAQFANLPDSLLKQQMMAGIMQALTTYAPGTVTNEAVQRYSQQYNAEAAQKANSGGSNLNSLAGF